MEAEYTGGDSQDSEMDYEQMLSKVFKISTNEPKTSKVMKVSRCEQRKKNSGREQAKKFSGSEQMLSKIFKVSDSEQSLSKVFKIPDSEPTPSKVMRVYRNKKRTKVSSSEQTLSKMFKVSDSEQSLSKVLEISGSESTPSKVMKVSKCEQTKKVSESEQVKKLPGHEQTSSVVSRSEQALLKTTESERSLSKVFKVSNSVQTSVPFLGSLDIQIKVERELDFDDLIDIQTDPITIKQEPMESCQVEEMSAEELCAIEDASPINEFDINGLCNIKTEPQECELDEIYNNDVIDFNAVKMEPEDVKQELIEATDIKIMDTFSQAPEAAIIRPPPIIKPPPVKKPKTRRKRKNPIKALNKKTSKNNIVVSKDFEENVRESTSDQNVLSKNVEENVIENTSNHNVLTKKVEMYSTKKSTDQNVTNSNVVELVTENSLNQNVLSKTVENATKNTPDLNKKSKKAPTVSTNSKSKTLKRIYACTRCGYTNTKKLFQIHVESKCRLQPAANQPNQYTKHANGLKEKRIYVCNKCGYSNTHKLYRIHINTKCELSTTADGSNKHTSYKNRRRNLIYTCKKCGYSNTHKLYRLHVDSQCGLLTAADRSDKYTNTNLAKDGRRSLIYTCNKCGYSNTHKLFRIHVDTKCEFLTTHDGSNDYTCTKCDTSFRTLKSYLLHFTTHGYGVHRCPSCNFKFESIENLLLHFYDHVRNNFVDCWMINKNLELPTKQNRCQICRDVVPQESFFSHWESHLKLTSSVKMEPKPITIDLDLPVLSNKALKPSVLSTALQELCKTSWAKNCLICYREFNRRNDCKRHVIEHLFLDAYSKKESTPENTLRCQICSEDFFRADQYKFHMREHGRLPVYQCDLCNKTFSDSSNFAKHKKIHSLQVLICDVCQKKFQAKPMLEKHMISHRDNDPMSCELCQKQFFTLSLFNKHMRSHEAQKFRCIPCELSFDSLRKKWDHDWAVHKERKYKADCPMCQKGFRKFHDVKMHAKLEHKVELSYYHMKSQHGDPSKRTICDLKNGRDGSLVVIIGTSRPRNPRTAHRLRNKRSEVSNKVNATDNKETQKIT